ncbi:MAG TPA: cation:proton antiport protein, partial [Hydrogenophaga sp.]|uniref:cation:proton antiporter domain-containing protein n=1 Tax=Hydrogenophaga sp. TaxID=1904254 RepID=UPI000E84A7DD
MNRRVLNPLLLVLAFVLGALAQRLRLSPLVGYLLAGVLVGPFTPGFVADPALAMELSEIGVILLMFGVGLHFSVEDLLEVKTIAIPGALVQITAATVMGWGLAWFLGWPTLQGIVFGLALSVASTVVLLRAMEDRRLLETRRGKIAVGWLIVEDLVMVVALVLLPALAESMGGGEAGARAGTGSVLGSLGWTLLKGSAFVAL